MKPDSVDYVAEIGLNHNGSADCARRLIDAAADSGATSVKFQTYCPEERVPEGHPLWDLLTECMLSPEETQELFAHARECGLGAFSTAFGLRSLQTLIDIEVERIKIASFNVAHEELIWSAAQYAPLVVATGTANRNEIARVTELLSATQWSHTLLHCISAYPTNKDEVHLSNIPFLKDFTGLQVGFSDHTQGWTAPAQAVLLGACLIEKHFTLSNQADGPDHAMSADPATFRRMVSECQQSVEVLGKPRSGAPYECEEPILAYRTVSKVWV